jgi:tripartite-type tricarboxylate transporter receptor subunit TctC
MNNLFQKVVVAGLIQFCAIGLVNAQSKEISFYPNKPIRIINPLATGGAVDTMARMLAPSLQEILGQPIVIESKPGAGGTIGSNFVAKSAPDGYTILMVYDTFAVNPHVYKNLPFDSFKDLAPVTELVKIPLVVVAGNKLSANNLRELADLSKSKAKGINFSSGGAGSSGHLAAELLKTNLGIDMTHVPYKGGAPAITDLLGGQVDTSFQNINAVIQHVRSGKLRAIAITSDKRSPLLTTIPTLTESGITGANVYSWQAIAGPKGLPGDIKTKLSSALTAALNDKGIKDRFTDVGFEIVASTPEQFASFQATEFSRWKKIIETRGISAD